MRVRIAIPTAQRLHRTDSLFGSLSSGPRTCVPSHSLRMQHFLVIVNVTFFVCFTKISFLTELSTFTRVFSAYQE